MSNQANNQGSAKGGENSNFHVCVRVRPTSSPSFDNQGHVEGIKYVRTGPENSILLVQPHSTQGDKVFIYDQVFDHKSNTKQIFDGVVLPNISESLFKGFSHTILVYGMTGAGKTFTMFGENFEESTQTVQISLNQQQQQENNRASQNAADLEVDGPLKKDPNDNSSNECKGGLVSETVKYVLANQTQSSKVKLKMSYLEIYNECIRDLLSSETLTAENLMILEDPDKGVYCPLLSEKEISTLDQITGFIKSGNKRRVMASTKLNQFSSRSHAIIQLSIEIELCNDGQKTTFLTPKLYMVDLAGSERAAATESKGIRFKEGANINKSLLSLGNCITVLSSQGEKGKKHVPYRDSKLTRLLKESLGGNAKTLFIACVTPAFKFVEETINTLKYAQRAKSIQKDVYENVKQIYNQIQNETVKEMHNEIENLKELLQQQQADLLGIQNGNLDIDDETIKQLQGISTEPPTEEQVVGSIQFKTHRELFKEKFEKLSEHYEDILFRNRELEFNLAEYNQSREQNERLVHEIMDTINPAALTQKEMKYRLDKVNTLRSIIKNNDEVIIKLQKELQENESMKNIIKKELEELYDVKFIQECQQLTNFQLISAFEQEKKKLKEEITNLVSNQQKQKEEQLRKELQIQNLKDEINFIKKKAVQSELQLQQNQADKQKGKVRGRGKQMTLRASSIIPNTKVTPRNVSQKDVSSKYLNFQTFVPSSNISVTTVRGKSSNMGQSMFISRKSEIQEPSNNNTNTQSFKQQSMSEINLSPTSREFEEYKRKEQIIESQLKNMQKNSSQKNVQGQQPNSRTCLDQANNNSLAQSSQSATHLYSSPNRQSNHLFKSSYKSSFIDLAPHSNDHASQDNSIGKNSYDMNRDSNDMDVGSQGNPNDYLRRSELTHQQYQKIIQHTKTEEDEQIKRSSFNVDYSSQKSNGSNQNAVNSQFVSPKPISKVKQQYGLSSSGSSQHSKTLSKNHSKTPSYTEDKHSSSTGGLKTYQGVFAPIIESHQEQSILNMTGQGSYDNTPQNHMQSNQQKPKESRFFLENSTVNNNNIQQNELLNPNSNFLFISQSQLNTPQMQDQFQQQLLQRQQIEQRGYNSSFNNDYSASKQMYSSPNTSNQKQVAQKNTPYYNSNQKISSQQTTASKNPNNNSSSTNSSINSNDNNVKVSSNQQNQSGKVNSITSLYQPTPQSGSFVSQSSSQQTQLASVNLYGSKNSSNESPMRVQNEPQPALKIKPSFNNYIQNSATYGAVNQQVLGQGGKIPTTAITLNLDNKQQ
ncbi:hypothetical protein ABPG74_012147 [Tetrahymena malaccensis]